MSEYEPDIFQLERDLNVLDERVDSMVVRIEELERALREIVELGYAQVGTDALDGGHEGLPPRS